MPTLIVKGPSSQQPSFYQRSRAQCSGMLRAFSKVSTTVDPGFPRLTTIETVRFISRLISCIVQGKGQEAFTPELVCRINQLGGVVGLSTGKVLLITKSGGVPLVDEDCMEAPTAMATNIFGSTSALSCPPGPTHTAIRKMLHYHSTPPFLRSIDHRVKTLIGTVLKNHVGQKISLIDLSLELTMTIASVILELNDKTLTSYNGEAKQTLRNFLSSAAKAVLFRGYYGQTAEASKAIHNTHILMAQILSDNINCLQKSPETNVYKKMCKIAGVDFPNNASAVNTLSEDLLKSMFTHTVTTYNQIAGAFSCWLGDMGDNPKEMNTLIQTVRSGGKTRGLSGIDHSIYESQARWPMTGLFIGITNKPRKVMIDDRSHQLGSGTLLITSLYHTGLDFAHPNQIPKAAGRSCPSKSNALYILRQMARILLRDFDFKISDIKQGAIPGMDPTSREGVITITGQTCQQFYNPTHDPENELARILKRLPE